MEDLMNRDWPAGVSRRPAKNPATRRRNRSRKAPAAA
jgi:hypothetical protein